MESPFRATSDSSYTASHTETPPPFRPRAHVIVVGNEKGGSGKTTATMHLIIALLRLGFTVGSMDIDSRQRSLSRYIENRRTTVAAEGVSLPLPHHIVIQKSPFPTEEEARKDERDRFARGLARIFTMCDFVIIDTPGNDTYLSRLAHSFADTVITPINDSFVDLDVLASVDGRTMEIIKPSIYSEMVWEQKLQRAKRDGKSIDWIVMRNRLSNIDARNKRFMTKVTEDLSRRIGFRLASGFSERVIFREMFLQGLTVLDVMEQATSVSVSMSHIAARQEVRDLLKMLKIDAVDERMRQIRTELRDAETQKETEEATPASASSEAPADTDYSAESTPAAQDTPLQNNASDTHAETTELPITHVSEIPDNSETPSETPIEAVAEAIAETTAEETPEAEATASSVASVASPEALNEPEMAAPLDTPSADTSPFLTAEDDAPVPTDSPLSSVAAEAEPEPTATHPTVSAIAPEEEEGGVAAYVQALAGGAILPRFSASAFGADARPLSPHPALSSRDVLQQKKELEDAS